MAPTTIVKIATATTSSRIVKPFVRVAALRRPKLMSVSRRDGRERVAALDAFDLVVDGDGDLLFVRRVVRAEIGDRDLDVHAVYGRAARRAVVRRAVEPVSSRIRVELVPTGDELALRGVEARLPDVVHGVEV